MLGKNISRFIEEKLLSFRINNDVLLFWYLFGFIFIISFPLVTSVQNAVINWPDFKITEQQSKDVIIDMSGLSYQSHAVKRLFRLTPAMIM